MRYKFSLDDDDRNKKIKKSVDEKNKFISNKRKEKNLSHKEKLEKISNELFQRKQR